jgi:hypothetical protein
MVFARVAKCYGAFHRNDRDLESRRRGRLVLELLLTNYDEIQL